MVLGSGDVVRTGAGSGYYFEVPDPHGTNDLYLDSTAQNPTWRQFTPYGAARGANVTWVDNRGFLNKPADTATGLTYIGPRAYDPVTGQFTSPDPVFEASNPQDWNPYLYAFDNPIGKSDPTGLGVTDGSEGCNGSACYDGYGPYVYLRDYRGKGGEKIAELLWRMRDQETPRGAFALAAQDDAANRVGIRSLLKAARREMPISGQSTSFTAPCGSTSSPSRSSIP